MRAAVAYIKFQIVFAVLPLAVGCTPTNRENEEKQHSVLETPEEAVLLLDSFGIDKIVECENSEPTKKTEYKDAVLEVAGTVSKIELERDANDAKTMFVICMREAPRFDAHCYFTVKDQETLQKIEIGQAISLKGRCTETYRTWIELQGCVLLKYN